MSCGPETHIQPRIPPDTQPAFRREFSLPHRSVTAASPERASGKQTCCRAQKQSSWTRRGPRPNAADHARAVAYTHGAPVPRQKPLKKGAPRRALTVIEQACL